MYFSVSKTQKKKNKKNKKYKPIKMVWEYWLERMECDGLVLVDKTRETSGHIGLKISASCRSACLFSPHDIIIIIKKKRTERSGVVWNVINIGRIATVLSPILHWLLSSRYTPNRCMAESAWWRLPCHNRNIKTKMILILCIYSSNVQEATQSFIKLNCQRFLQRK